jgi:uncharacterized protein with FMN-binding domain
MKRSPIVLAGTAVGLAGVFAYNTSASPAVVGASAGTTAAQSASTTASSATATATTASSTTPAASTSTSKSTTSTAAKSASRTRSATGQDVSFRYGDLEVKVTKVGTRITDVSVVAGNANDPHSQSIDQVALPELRQEALSAQSAKIDGVSGASYTSAAYDQSLQSALDKLA